MSNIIYKKYCLSLIDLDIYISKRALILNNYNKFWFSLTFFNHHSKITQKIL